MEYAFDGVESRLGRIQHCAFGLPLSLLSEHSRVSLKGVRLMGGKEKGVPSVSWLATLRVPLSHNYNKKIIRLRVSPLRRVSRVK